MMTPELLFQLVSTLVLPAWLLLLFAPRWRWTARIAVGGVVLLLSVTYAVGAWGSFGESDLASFGSLEGVMTLFTQPEAVVVGWIHYLAFDLLVGWLITRNAHTHGISPWLVAPCLLLTFMLGPTGWLLYWMIRSWRVKSLFPVES
jgi:hypothetical protein